MNGRSEGEYPALSAFAGGLLAVHAHPDDETLSTGGLIAALAAAGWPVCVVTCTRGERGEVIARPGTTSEGRAGLEGDGPALGAYRETELASALAQLAEGADRAIEHAFLDTLPLPVARAAGASPSSGASGSGLAGSDVPGADVPGADVPGADGSGFGGSGAARYEDSGMAWMAPGVAGPAPDSPPTAFARVPLDEAAGRLAALIRVRRPAVVATYEPGGGYGHPDHVRAHQVTVRALELAADPAWPGDEPSAGARAEPWAGAELWQAVAPAAEVRKARATLAAHPAARTLAATEALTFAGPGDPLPPLARENLEAWSAKGQKTGSSDHRSPDVLPISRADGVAWVDARGVLGRVVGAMRAHATQVQHATALARPEGPVAGWYALSNNVLAPILTHETYLVTPPR